MRKIALLILTLWLAVSVLAQTAPAPQNKPTKASSKTRPINSFWVCATQFSDVELEERHNTNAFKDQLAAALISGIIKVGHAALQMYPDMPFLRFRYKNSSGRTVQRDNPAVFTTGCRRIFEFFGYNWCRGSAVLSVREPYIHCDHRWLVLPSDTAC
jgi:hypothetical protein